MAVMTESARNVSERAVSRRKLPLKPERVLVADDDHLIAKSIAAWLRSLGYTPVGPARDGKVALELAAGEPVDLAVLDNRMPVMSGLEAARHLWEGHAIPTVIVSAYSDEESVQEAAACGVFGYLVKPATVESLKVAITVAWAKAMREAEQTGRISQLEENLRHRRVVEEAKWRLVEQYGLSEADAHARMQRAARDARAQLIRIAERLNAGEDPKSMGISTSGSAPA